MANQQCIPLIIDGKDITLGEREFPVVNAAQNKTVATARGASIEVAIQAVESAQRAFPIWASVKPQERRRLLQNLAKVIESWEAEFIKSMTEETSFTVPYAEHNVRASVEFILEAAALATCQALEGSIPSTTEDNCLALVLNEPLGVILSIVPWNAPLILGVRSFLGALVAGNTVVVKGSELSPQTHYLMVKAVQEAGFPPGVVNLVQHRPEDAQEINTTMIAHRAVRKVTFTGSTHVGAIIAATAAKHLKPSLMELGGKCPLIILEDADLEAAANAAVLGAFINSGQICMSTERIIVVKSAVDELLKHIRSKLSTFPARCDMVSEKAANRALGLIDDALGKGAVLQTGTREDLLHGGSMATTVISNLTPKMELFTTESFGACVGIIEVEDAVSAVSMANDSFYGLSASVFTKDIARGIAIGKMLQSGAVHINSMTLHDEATLPHGGVKDSGFGRFGGRWGISEFIQTKNILVHGIKI